ncbi:EAL domain-containing protein [Vibrio hannami]|uniref:putative bifunctional diguanylate cyclase/phosphodiesterase n=1 Tax=Vibrio hannami TaxID=2717094 RepID=UPI00240EA1F9|nr:EAL domain-containing protein [Vibrio hannami]MDG3088518.1 EAL domain-containing protein [Vibrio hannami]
MKFTSLKVQLVLAIAFASTLLFAMVGLYSLGNSLLIKRTPILEATEKIKIHTTTAHLWFEEILSGDNNVDIKAVWGHLDNADWYIDALLDGGTNTQGTYFPVYNQMLRDRVLSIKAKSADFSKIEKVRYQNADMPSTDIILDEQSDKIFLDLIKEINELSNVVKNDYYKNTIKYQSISYLIIGIAIAGSILLLYVLYIKQTAYLRLFRSLKSAKEAIEQKNEDLHKQAHFDALTGLPNRVLLIDRLERTIQRAKRSSNAFAVIFIDLDHFKEVNDTFGHHAGDLLLQMVSKRIQSTIRSADTAARISGDEFIVILDGLQDADVAMQASSKVAGQLVRTISNAYRIEENTALISASIGVAIYPEDSKSADELIKCSDNAMYYAKSLGKNNFQFYSGELNLRSIRHSGIENELRSAILNDDFVVHYQPRWSFDTSELVGVEALVRWKHPERGVIQPDEFLPFAETGGVIDKIDLAVTNKVIQQLVKWKAISFEVGFVSINLSKSSFKQKSFISDLCKLISESDIDPSRLEIEVKEQILEDDKYIRHVFSRLKSLGVRLSLDDYGTDTVSINSLKDYQFNTLKIDRSYIHEQAKNPTLAIVLQNIIKMAADLGIEVVAEGVETEEQKKQMQAFGCRSGQGYVLTRPMDADSLESTFSKPKNNVVHLRRR